MGSSIHGRTKKFDEEDNIWLKNTIDEIEKGNIEKNDLFPFKFPSGSNTLFARHKPLKTYLTALLPLYDTIFYELPHGKGTENEIGLSKLQLIELSEKKRAIPIIFPQIEKYDNDIKEFILEHDAPYLTYNNMMALRHHFCIENNLLNEKEYFNNLKLLPELSNKEWVVISKKEWAIVDGKDIQNGGKFKFLQDKEKWTRFNAKEIELLSKVAIASSRNVFIESMVLNSTLQQPEFFLNLSNKFFDFVNTDDFNLSDVWEDYDDFGLDEYGLEYIVKNLKIAYTPDMNIKDYLEIFDNNTTRKIRNIMKDIGSIRANSKDFHKLKILIDDYNSQVVEFSNEGRAKLLMHTTQVMKYNYDAMKMLFIGPLKKFLGVDLSKFGLPEDEKKMFSGWVGEKTEGAYAKLLGKSVPVLQLWKIRRELEKN